MEAIKDLDLLVSDGQKIANFAKLFTRLPEILQALSSAENYLKEINSAVNAKQQEFIQIQADVELTRSNLQSLQDKSANLALFVANAEGQAKKRLAEVEAKENAELERIRKANNDAVESSIKLMKYEMGSHQNTIAESKKAMEAKIAEHQTAIGKYAKQESDARDKAADAQKELNALLAKFKG